RRQAVPVDGKLRRIRFARLGRQPESPRSSLETTDGRRSRPPQPEVVPGRRRWLGPDRSPSVKYALFVLLTLPAFAQDTRTVVEPSIPPSCTVLAAKLPKHLSDADESKLDTARIQEALDHCSAGHAVELKADGEAASFLSGPLQLRAGVTLLVDAHVTLYGSRNPRDYDITPGACGTVDKGGRACKPLIGGTDIAGAGVMGEGVIDGRGNSRLLGQNVSWWDLAQEAKVKNLNQNCPRILVLNHADN